MSDVFAHYHRLRLNKDLSNVELSSSEFHYAYSRGNDKVIFAVKIPFPLLKLWHEIVQEDRYNAKVNFVDLLEWSVPGNAFVFISEEKVRNRINDNIRKIAGSVVQEYRKTKGRARKQLNDRSRNFHIREGEIKTVDQWNEELGTLRNEVEEWRKRYDDIEKAKKDMFDCLVQEIANRDRQIQHLQESNAELQSYISVLENENEFQGKPLSSTKNKSRTLNCFLNRAKTALWFFNSFGLDIQALLIKDQESGDTHMLDLNGSQKGKNYNNLTNEEKSKVEQVLYLLDKFCVGDKFYHEFSFICEGLPKSYLIKQCRSNLNDMCHLSSLPGPYHGSKVNSLTDLLKVQVTDFFKNARDFSVANDKIKIKVNGDGARMTRNSNYIILSFSLLQSGQDVMSAKGNRTIAIVDAPENYEVLRDAFQSIFQEIKDLIQSGSIEVNGQHLNTEFFLGGDYKFILLMLGLKSATADYACAWCKIPKEDRWKVDTDFSNFNKLPLCRTLKEILTLYKNHPSKKNNYNYGCEREPLIKIQLDHVVVDELHLMLRVTDILLENVIDAALDWDKIIEVNRARGQERGVQLKKTVEHIKSLGISFDVWEEKNADGRASGRYKWTSLTGDDKKKLLKEFPKKEGTLELFQCQDLGQKVIEIWNNFGELYAIINTWSPEQDPSIFHLKAVAWVKLFVSLNGKMKGYERRRVTPYMHILVAHVPYFLQMYKSLKVFTGQGVEKNNDVARSVVLRKSNKWDSTADILRVESRQWSLRDNERKRRKYEKKNAVYWEEGIKKKTKRQFYLKEKCK